jgi:hypothetical protein
VTFLLARVPGVAAYFSGADTYPRTVQPRSNERQMIYVNVDALAPGQDAFDSTMAHEFQHLLHFARCPQQETWVDEGSSELASRVDGFPTPSPQAFAGRPDVQLTAWSTGPPDQVRHYQAAYLFLRYVAERYGGWETLRQLLGPCLRGEDLFSAFLRQRGEAEGFDDLFADWTVANLVDDTAVGDGRYGYADAGGNAGPDGTRGLKVQPTATAALGQPLQGAPPQFAADYVELPPGATTGSFSGAADVPLVAAQADSPGGLWWSNRGDNVDTRLTRRLDLRGVDHATARFRAWYDVEDQYDYVYLSGSRDGGATWTVLAGQAATAANAVGNGLGPGWTGTSGGGATPTWIDEQVDLGPLVGSDALLRFDYVTDQAYNGGGFALADFAVPELGLSEPGAVDGPWSAEGWLRVDAPEPQPWQLRLVQWLPAGLAVTPVPVDAAGQATFGLDPSASRGALVVAPTAPRTLSPANYSVSVSTVAFVSHEDHRADAQEYRE